MAQSKPRRCHPNANLQKLRISEFDFALKAAIRIRLRSPLVATAIASGSSVTIREYKCNSLCDRCSLKAQRSPNGYKMGKTLITPVIKEQRE